MSKLRPKTSNTAVASSSLFNTDKPERAEVVLGLRCCSGLRGSPTRLLFKYER